MNGRAVLLVLLGLSAAGCEQPVEQSLGARELIVVSPDAPLPSGLAGELTCEARVVDLCLEGDCQVTEDSVTLQIDFGAARLEICSEGAVDVCDFDAILGHTIETGMEGEDVIHLRTRRGLLSTGWNGREAGGAFVHTSHALRTVVTLSGTCSR